MTLQHRRIEFIKDLIENDKQGTWNDYALKYDLKDSKQASDFWRYYERTGNVSPDYDGPTIEDNEPDYYAGVEGMQIPEGFKIKKAWGKSGSMQMSLEKIDTEEIDTKFEDLIESLKKHSPKFPVLDHKEDARQAIMLSIPDLHYGKGPLHITSKSFKEAISNLVSRYDLTTVEKFIVPIGNDILNSDGNTKATTKGTPQFDSADPWTCFDTALKDCVDVLTWLSTIAPVEVYHIAGNHDRYESFTLLRAVEGYTHNNENISILNNQDSRQYAQYGVTGFMFEHGELKMDAYPNVFAAEQPKLWGNTIYREAILGHTHHQQTKEFRGFVCRYLTSLGVTDKWHKDNAYMSMRAAQSYSYDKDLGFRGLEEYRIV